MESIKIQIPSLIENIRIVESFIDNTKEKYHINDDLYGNIMIAVTESVSNAIKHGNKGIKEKQVTLSLVLAENKINFIVEDQGSGFDYQNLPDPTSPENIEKTGGRGIFIIQNLCDEVEFRDSGRVVEMSFLVY